VIGEYLGSRSLLKLRVYP